MGKRALEVIPRWGQNRYFGKVFMGFIINKKGVVVIPHVIWTSGHSGLDVGNFVCRCRIIGIEIRPGRSKGKKVATGCVLSIAFYLSR